MDIQEDEETTTCSFHTRYENYSMYLLWELYASSGAQVIFCQNEITISGMLALSKLYKIFPVVSNISLFIQIKRFYEVECMLECKKTQHERRMGIGMDKITWKIDLMLLLAFQLSY